MIDRISQILNARWLISQEVVYNYFPAFLALMNGQKFDFMAAEKERQKPYLLTVESGIMHRADNGDIKDGNQTPENSICIIPIQGEILAWRTMELVKSIEDAENNPNIIAIIFLVNSPGGMVFYTDIAAKCIKDLEKPSVAFVMNMAASAAMWLISGTDRIICSSPLDRIGSIGTMASVMDMAGFLKKKLGIDVFEIYADKSTNKNMEIRTLLDESLSLEERTALIREDLNYVNEYFHKAIQDNLSIDPASDVFTGKIFNATQAIDKGLAHEINTFEYAVTLANQMGIKYQINKFINLNNY
ncbi:MAG: S49 family peptidase [Bacteroidales bacterium]